MGNSKKIKVGIVDSRPAYREGLRAILDEYDDVEFIADAYDRLSIMGRLQAGVKIDIILLDVQPFGNDDGLLNLKFIKEKYPDIRFICMIDTLFKHPSIIELMEHASACIERSSEPDEIHDAIVGAYKSDFYTTQIVEEAISKNLKLHKPGNYHPDSILSEKETMIVKLLCEEKTSKEIAEIMKISVRTIESNRDRIRTKTGTRSLAGLVLYAVHSGIVTP